MKKEPVVKTSPRKEKATEADALPMKQRVLRSARLSAWVLFGFVATSLVVGIAIELLMAGGIISQEFIGTAVFNATFAAVVYTLTLVIVIGAPYKWRGLRTTKEELGLTRPPNWSDILLAPASFVVYTVFAAVLMYAAMRLFPGFDAEQAQNVGFDNISSYYEYVLAFITLVVIAPVAEEVLMRGYLYGKLRKFIPIAAATIITSLLFSLMHFQWNVALNVLPLGIVLVALREHTGSIWAGILLHMLKNGIAFYLLFVNPITPGTIGL